MSGICPDCEAPNAYCVCVLNARIKAAEREAARHRRRAERYRVVAQAAASCIAHNRSRLGKPRGPDEERLIAYIEQAGITAMGPFWSGRTDGCFPAVAPAQRTRGTKKGGDRDQLTMEDTA